MSRKSLADQILALSNPQPASFHPDEEILEDETSAKLCDFTYEEEAENSPSAGLKKRRAGVKRRRLELVEEDPRYAGKVVSRKEFQDLSPSEGSEESEVESSASDEDEGESEVEEEEVEGDHGDDSVEEFDDESGDVTFDQSEAEDPGKEEGGVMTLPMKSLMENMEKGEAARKQMRLLDGLLETRIKFQGVLSLANRLPAPSVRPLFLKEGGAPLQETLDETCKNLCQLLDSLLELQTTLRQTNTEEELDSDSEEVGGATPTRKRKRSDGGADRDYAMDIAERHRKLRPHCEAVISKWNEKTKLAGGKVTSKAFMEVDRSTLSQIEHVLKDKERLRRRTQLKRSVYRILGEEEEQEGPEGKTDQSQPERDLHLKDYNEHIFDDDDFYHQLLRELIERKTSYTESSDPIEMGRQWLELQKLRRKAKKVVDTKASKGRKIRYNVHPKLVNFMAPVDDRKSFSDTSKNNLFSSLFGARYK